MTLPIIRTIAELRHHMSAWRQAGQRVALIPTMGALHAGHLSLVRLGQQHADRTVTTIFINPKQFGPQDDFQRYPRQEAQDATNNVLNFPRFY